MRVQELVENIKDITFDINGALEIKKYLPINVKKTIAQSIIYECIDDTEGVIKLNSLQKDMSYIRYMITMHTNLEYTDDDYDTLCSIEFKSTKLMSAIVDCFADDAKECLKILNLMIDDYMRENTIEFTVAKFLNKLTESIGNIADVLNDKVGEFNIESIIPKDIDMERINTFLKEINM